MKTLSFPVCLMAGLLLLIASTSAAQAVGNYTIYYQTSDLPDVNPGEDLWQYRYSVDGPSFLTDQGFDIFFRFEDAFFNGSLDSAPTPPNPDWDMFTIQPEPALPLPHDGFLEAYALQDNPDLSNWFIINFIWSGTGTPGAQPFDIIDSDFSILESGMTTLVPIPAAWLLMLSGLYFLKRRRS